ncbi:hypothetical protein FO519_004537 [Halicephalobus sp. NKZ332]|nr:hypothetical protein FO519_004537 [Halicephalobus sp. NKZ332]
MSFLLEYLSDEERSSIEQRMKKICEGFQAAITSIPEVDENGATNGHIKAQKKLKEFKAVQVRRSPRKSKPIQSYSPIRSLQKTPNKTEKVQNGKLKRKVLIPATPDETVIKKCKSEPAILDKEVVAETPAEQTRKRLRDRDSKALTQLWGKMEEAKEKKRRASRRLSFIPGDDCQASSLLSFNGKMSNGSSHCSTMVSMSRVSSSKSLSSVSGISISSAATSTTALKNSVPTKVLNAANCLTDEILQRYRKRMELVRSLSKKADSNEIFYGRAAGRKNRSGRKVTQDFGAVHVAHTLLNTHNETPLQPFKRPKDAPFKVRKLVKHATRGDWKKLQKFIQKTQIDAASSRSAS